MKRYQRLGLLSLLTVLLLFACITHGGDEGKKGVSKASRNETVMRVNHYMSPCEGVGPQLCLLVQIGGKVGSNEWEFFYESIEGFENYRFGYIYDLSIATEKVKRPPQDAASIVFKLLNIQSKSRVGPDISFVLPLTRVSGESHVTGSKQSGFALLGRIKIKCETPLCSQLEKLIASGENFNGTFRHADLFDDTIVLLALSK
jgi:hypothetical protein